MPTLKSPRHENSNYPVSQKVPLGGTFCIDTHSKSIDSQNPEAHDKGPFL